MGLTVFYHLRSHTRSDQKALRLVEQMRQLALDLPFEEVGDIITLEGEQADFEQQRGKIDESRFWLLVQSSLHIDCPWNHHISRSVSPVQVAAFTAISGPGSEPTNIGLARYRSEIEWEYRPSDDQRFQEEYRPHGPSSTAWRFSWRKWRRWLERNNYPSYLSPNDERFIEVRKVKTRLSGWWWSAFTKTQYASGPEYGGIANFLRCHISVVTLLDRIGKLPTVKVQIDDEGKFGPSHYSDDWQVAKAEGREPTYRWHEGRYDAKALAQEVGEWNGMVAAFTGAMTDLLDSSGPGAVAPIQDFSNFEQLEFQGSQDERLQSFLRTMAQFAEQERRNHGAA